MSGNHESQLHQNDDNASVGKIHGIISREDAWRMWAPYGERLSLNGSVVQDEIGGIEMLFIIMNSEQETKDNLKDFFRQVEQEDLSRGICKGRAGWYNPRFVEAVSLEQANQQREADLARERAYETSDLFLRLLGHAASKLTAEGILLRSEYDTFEGWLYGSDGNPSYQYTPMSKLEFGRLAYSQDGEWMTDNNEFCTDYATGSIWSTVNMRDKDNGTQIHNRVHEHVHAVMSGLELYDITKENGTRQPSATVKGVDVSGLTNSITDRQNAKRWKNVELNEAWVEYMARELMRVEPRLGTPMVGAIGYEQWAATVSRWRVSNPVIFRTITRTIFVEATPTEHSAKRIALQELDAAVEKEFGDKDALVSQLAEEGGTLSDAIRPLNV